VEIFIDDDDGYVVWSRTNWDGYVLKCNPRTYRQLLDVAQIILQQGYGYPPSWALLDDAIFESVLFH
jgi:hypothetical protein